MVCATSILTLFNALPCIYYKILPKKGTIYEQNTHIKKDKVCKYKTHIWKFHLNNKTNKKINIFIIIKS